MKWKWKIALLNWASKIHEKKSHKKLFITFSVCIGAKRELERNIFIKKKKICRMTNENVSYYMPAIMYSKRRFYSVRQAVVALTISSKSNFKRRSCKNQTKDFNI